MKRIRIIAHYYVDYMVKLGMVRFSLLLALVLVILTMLLMMTITFLFQGRVESLDIWRSLLLSSIITPCAVYFLSIIVDQLEQSRQKLSQVVNKLQNLHQRDILLHNQLQENITQLNQEIQVRIEAETARQRTLTKLENVIAINEQAQNELKQQTSLLRSFLDASPDLVFYRDANFAFSGCNRAMELLLGKGEKQLIGLTPQDVYNENIAKKVIETDEKVFQHHISITYEIWSCYPDGRNACFEVRKVPFYDNDGNRKGIMGFGRDITEHKRYQEALEKASRDKTTFISTISHELRTPLNGIVGLSRILLDTQLTKEQEDYLKTVYVSAVTLGNIFNDIVELDKVEQRRTQLDIQPINFIDFLSDVKNIAGLLAAPKGLGFNMVQHGELPHHIMADNTRLRQILWNLINNALKFTQQGQVVVTVWYDDDLLYFSVADTGIGIPHNELDKIFAMYYQVSHTDNNIPGTGIGLAVSQRLAQAMGGSISVKSELGKGSCFTLSIKAPKAEEQHEDNVDDLPILHILLVEDIELNVTVARSVLEKMGHTLDVAMTGQQALALFTPQNYDLILLDIQLPDMTGFDIARTLRQRFREDELPPIIALTANVLKDRNEFIDSGMSDVLSKPLSVNALITIIRKYWCHPSISSKGTTEKLPELNAIQQGSIIDIPMLTEYIQLVGPQLIEQSLIMFEQMMPEYLTILKANQEAHDQKGIVEEAHKIKGAAGSIGLCHLQQLSQQIQSPDLLNWHSNLDNWIKELNLQWQNDVDTLRSWLKAQI